MLPGPESAIRDVRECADPLFDRREPSEADFEGSLSPTISRTPGQFPVGRNRSRSHDSHLFGSVIFPSIRRGVSRISYTKVGPELIGANLLSIIS